MKNYFEGKKVLVTGGSGFVGTNLIISLLEQGANVYGGLHKKPAQIDNPKINWVYADLLNPEDCRRITRNMDFVFMCAANTSGAAVMDKNPLAHVTPNVIMNTNMLDAAYAFGIKKFLFISSSTVYPAYDRPVKENEWMPGPPFEKYYCVGWMKRFIEIECKMYAEKIKNPMKTIIVRPGNLFGEYDDFEWETSHVLPALIRRVVERHNPVEVWGDGEDLKDLIYIGDFIEGMLLCMEKIDTYNPINIGRGKTISINQALKMIMEIDGYNDAVIKYDSDKPSMISFRQLDTDKAKKELGFIAHTSMYDGLKKTITWYKKKHLLK